MANRQLIAGTVVVAGTGTGLAIVSNEPLSLWGGLDPNTGEIIDRRHPLSGRNVAGAVLVIPRGRGSCSASGVLLEAIRNRKAPAVILVRQVDPIIGLGSILGDELYGTPVPVIALTAAEWAIIPDGAPVEALIDGTVIVAG